MCTILCAGVAVTHSGVDIVGRVEPEELLGYGDILSKLASVDGQKRIVTELRELGAYGG